MSPWVLLLIASVPGLSVSWTAPNDCPTGEQVQAAVARMLGDDARSEPPLSISGDVAFTGDEWRVLIKNASGGERTLSGSTCRAVSSAAVVVIALMVDPLAQTDQAPVLEEQPAPPRAFELGVTGLFDSSSLPKPTPGLGVTASLGLAAGFHLELTAQGWLSQVTAEDPGPGGSFFLLTGGLGVRRAFELTSASSPIGVDLGPVLSVEVGALRGRSFGVTDPTDAWAAWVAPRAGLFIGFTLGVLRVGLRGEVAVPLTRPRFVVDGVGVLHTSPPVTGRGGLSLELHFPPRVATAPATNPP